VSEYARKIADPAKFFIGTESVLDLSIDAWLRQASASISAQERISINRYRSAGYLNH
jgi:hypothetical protein